MNSLVVDIRSPFKVMNESTVLGQIIKDFDNKDINILNTYSDTFNGNEIRYFRILELMTKDFTLSDN